MSVSRMEGAPVQRHGRRIPLVAQVLSVIPGLGQVYYGAVVRGAQYFAGVAVSMALAAVIYQWSIFDLARAQIGPLAKSLAFLGSELLVLVLVVSFVSFWIAAWHDAKQGVLALNAGADRHPTWWFVKVKQFLFDDPETEEVAPHE